MADNAVYDTSSNIPIRGLSEINCESNDNSFTCTIDEYDFVLQHRIQHTEEVDAIKPGTGIHTLILTDHGKTYVSLVPTKSMSITNKVMYGYAITNSDGRRLLEVDHIKKLVESKREQTQQDVEERGTYLEKIKKRYNIISQGESE